MFPSSPPICFLDAAEEPVDPDSPGECFDPYFMASVKTLNLDLSEDIDITPDSADEGFDSWFRYSNDSPTQVLFGEIPFLHLTPEDDEYLSDTMKSASTRNLLVGLRRGTKSINADDAYDPRNASPNIFFMSVTPEALPDTKVLSPVVAMPCVVAKTSDHRDVEPSIPPPTTTILGFNRRM